MNILKAKTTYFFILSILFASCSFNKHSVNKDFIGPNEVAFLELIQTQEGEVIQGIAPRGRRIDSPSYRFDSAKNEFELLRKGDFSFDTIKVLLGEVKILKGTSGSGVSSHLNGVRRMPYASNNLIISEVDSEGVQLVFNETKIIIKAGDEWQTSKIVTDTIKAEPIAIVKTIIIYKIHYFGKLSKALIK